MTARLVSTKIDEAVNLLEREREREREMLNFFLSKELGSSKGGVFCIWTLNFVLYTHDDHGGS